MSILSTEHQARPSWLKDKKLSPTYKEMLEVHKAIQAAETPMNNRVMYYYRIPWLRHPIKAYKQRRILRKLLRTK